VLSVLLATLTLGFVVAGIAAYGWLGMLALTYCKSGFSFEVHLLKKTCNLF
jgi:hypothetical protein